MGRRRKAKRKTHVRVEDDPAKKGPPKSFVFWRGQYGLLLKGLETDLRKVMAPYTASNLKESKTNQLKDFVSIAGPLGVSQFLILTATENSCYLRIAKVPRGPTLTMRIHKYSLMRDIVASQQRPRLPDSLWKTSPLVVMNNFAGEEHLRLATVLFQNLFPSINVQTARLSTCQRVILLNYDKKTNLISFRHYSIRVQPSGVTKSVKQLVARRQLPDLSGFQDVAEFLTKSGYGSESEGEEAASSRVVLAQDLGRGNLASRQSRIQLQEIGPRLELEVMKAEEGICNGKVLYHRYVKKSAAEAAAQATIIKDKEELREKRRRHQEENVRKKEQLKKRKAEGAAEVGANASKKAKKQWWEEELQGSRQLEEDDDVEHYRQEVGEEPEEMHGLRSKARSGKGRMEGKRDQKGYSGKKGSSGRSERKSRSLGGEPSPNMAGQGPARGRSPGSKSGPAGGRSPGSKGGKSKTLKKPPASKKRSGTAAKSQSSKKRKT